MPIGSEITPNSEQTFDYWYEYQYGYLQSIREEDERNNRFLVTEPNGYKHIVQFPIESDVVSFEPFEAFDINVYPRRDQRTALSYLNSAKGFVRKFESLYRRDCGSLYMFSETAGTGKTTLSRCICEALKVSGHSVVFYRAKDLVDDLRHGNEQGTNQPEWQVLKRCRDSDLLVLDDIGTERISEYVNDQMFDIVDHRTKYRKPTVYTSNVIPEKLPYMDKVRNRIKASTLVMKFPEYSVRVQKSEANRAEMMEYLMEA